MHLAVVLAAVVGATPPWEGEPFAGEPRAVADAAAQLTGGAAEIDVLLEETAVVLDEAGRETSTFRLVWVPRTAAAASEWGSIRSGYSPRYQHPPEIRVRVIAAGGEARWLDPATLTDGVIDEGHRQVYSDRRAVQGPLPGIQAGVVVEEWYRIRGKEPFFAAGTVSRLSAGRPIPVRKLRMAVEAPASLPLRHLVRGLPEAQVIRGATTRRVALEASDLPAFPEQEELAPPGAVAQRQLAYATGRSWREVAQAYQKLVEQQLAGADLAATAREVIGERTPLPEAARRVLAWIAARTRYTALSLGEAGLVPARPADTLARGYGDCKDLSVLAAGLLRAAGFEASIVLLRTAADDAEEELPGIGTFDHAVVRAGGGDGVWLDPAADTVAPRLGIWAQGKLGLVVHPKSERLVRTPEEGPEGSRLRREVRIELAELAEARVVEETWYEGMAAADFAHAAESADGKDWEKRVRERLGASEGSAVEASRSARGPGPHQRNVAKASSWGYTRDGDAEAVVGPSAVFRRLPGSFRTEPLEAGAKEASPPRRTRPMRLLEPHRAEITYRVVPPVGFGAVEPLPSLEGFRIGSARFEAASSREPDGAVRLTYRFEVGRLLAPADAEALWRAVADRTRVDGPRVRFERTSRALLRAGKGREALEEIRRLCRLHPAEAMHQVHLATTLLTLRMGEAARAAAERAVALEPESEWTHRVLAYTLTHDLLGRPYRAGIDLARAEAELRKAKALDPRSAHTRGLLGQVLLRGSDGKRLSGGERVGEAAGELRAVHHELKVRDYDEDLLVALLRARRDAEALTLARQLTSSPVRNAVLLAAAFRSGGIESLRREAEGLPESARAAAGQAAVVELMNGRDFAVVAKMARMGTEQLPEPGRTAARKAIDLMGNARPVEELVFDRADPAQVPPRFVQAAVATDPRRALAAVLAAGNDPEVALSGFIRGLRGGTESAMADLELRPASDIAAAGMQVAVEPGGPPWRMKVVMAGAPGKEVVFHMYVVEQGGEARLLEPSIPGLVREALRLARAGDAARARRALGWARAELAAKKEGAEEETRVLAGLWTSGDQAGARELAVAAAGLAAFGAAPEEAVAELERARPALAGEARESATLALFRGLQRLEGGARNHDRCGELERESPALASVAREACYWVALRSGRAAAARDRARAEQAASPGNRPALRMLANALHETGEQEEAERTWTALIGGEPLPMDWNNGAWSLLFRQPIPEKALEWARVAVEKRPGSGGTLHTLATAQAWNDRPAEAMETLLRSVDAGDGEVGDYHWLVVGRVAESYGLPEEARRAYARVTRPAWLVAQSSWELAHRRLLALDGAR